MLDPNEVEKAWESFNESRKADNSPKLTYDESRNLFLKEYAHADDHPEGPEFAQLFRFLDEDFVKTHPYIFFSTETENFVYEIFAVSYIEAEPEFKYYSCKVPPEQAYDMAKQAVDHSIWLYPEVKINPDDKDAKFISLTTTPYGYYENGADNEKIRFVVTGRLLPADAILTETCKVEKNPNPVEPALEKKS